MISGLAPSCLWVSITLEMKVSGVIFETASKRLKKWCSHCAGLCVLNREVGSPSVHSRFDFGNQRHVKLLAIALV